MQFTIEQSFKPRKWQQECIDSMTRFSVWALHRRAGKTTLAINLISQYCLKKPGRYLYIAPTLTQAKDIAWATCKDVAREFIVTAGGRTVSLAEIYESDHSVRFQNGSIIKLAGADNPDGLRGNKLSGAVLDEVAQMPREVWSEVVQPALLDSNGWGIFIGTPKGINLFSELFMRGQDPAFKPDWSSARYTCYETDALTENQIAIMKRDQSAEEFKREMLCDFSASTSDQLLSLNDVMQAAERRVMPEAYSRYRRIMGVDVARYGDDNSVIVIRRGQTVQTILAYHDLDLVTLAGKVAACAKENGIKTIYIDGTGVGGGVPDILHAMGVQCFDVNFGQRSTESMYANMRSEMWGKMAQWIKGGGCIPRNDQLIKELAAPLYEKGDDGKIKLEAKKNLRKRLGFSPDIADALALTFCNWSPEAEVQQDEFTDRQYGAQTRTPMQRFETSVRKANGRSYAGNRAGSMRSARFYGVL